MALADMIAVIASEAEDKKAKLIEENDLAIKSLLDNAEEEGKQYSSQKFKDFEVLQAELEKKNTSDIQRNEKN